MAPVSDDQVMLDALRQQSAACGALGSSLYRDLLASLAEDFAAGGVTRALLAGSSDRPVHDAIALRMMGAVHRLVLRGEEPALARHYGSVGGTPGPTVLADLLEVLARRADDIRIGLGQQVQTNEVGRSVVPLSVLQWLPSIGVQRTRWLEIGASAGLNLSFDRFGADTGAGVIGVDGSPVWFEPSWFGVPPTVVDAPAVVTERRGADAFPIELDDAGVERLLSFVWPDQSARFGRLRAAIAIARDSGIHVERASADEWLARTLPLTVDAPVVVFHSIVWQYLADQVRRGLREALRERGAQATPRTPVAWIRMEPAGAVAEIQATVWRGDEEPEQYRLGDVGFHGQQLHWRPERVVDHVSSRPWGA